MLCPYLEWVCLIVSVSDIIFVCHFCRIFCFCFVPFLFTNITRDPDPDPVDDPEVRDPGAVCVTVRLCLLFVCISV